MKKQIERTIFHIRDLERRLNEADNNLRYIKVVIVNAFCFIDIYTICIVPTILKTPKFFLFLPPSD